MVWVDSNALWQLGIAPFSLVAVHQSLREACCLLQHGTSPPTASLFDPNKERNMCLWHDDEPGPDCTVVHTGTQQWSQLPLGNPKFHLHDEDTFLYFTSSCSSWSKERTFEVKTMSARPSFCLWSSISGWTVRRISIKFNTGSILNNFIQEKRVSWKSAVR